MPIKNAHCPNFLFDCFLYVSSPEFAWFFLRKYIVPYFDDYVALKGPF